MDANDLAFHHTTYADELVPLTIADMQLEQITGVLEVDSDNADMGSDDEDDLVYQDTQWFGT